MHRGLFRSQIEPVMNHLYTYYIKRKINSKLAQYPEADLNKSMKTGAMVTTG